MKTIKIFLLTFIMFQSSVKFADTAEVYQWKAFPGKTQQMLENMQEAAKIHEAEGAVVAIDRMYTGISDNGTFTISRDTDVPSGYGFVNSMKLDCTTADTSVASGSFHTVEYRFEGQDTQIFKKGTSSKLCR